MFINPGPFGERIISFENLPKIKTLAMLIIQGFLFWGNLIIFYIKILEESGIKVKNCDTYY
jgi:hypothetical protein